MANLNNRSEAFRLWERSLAKFVPGVFTPVLVQRRIRTGATGHLVGLTGSYLETGLETISLQMNDHTDRGTEAASMVHRKKSKRSKAKTILRLPDLEQSKNAVLHSLAAPSSQESYGHAIDEFIGWYCSEPRLAFNRTVVLRYRFFLEQKNLAPSTINVRLAAVRRLAYEASDTGLLSPDLAAGIRRVKGAKRLGVRIGNWLTVDQSRTLFRESPSASLRGKRDQAILALLVACGLRRAELAGLETKDFQVREGHWVIADLIGKGKHIRTVPVPAWAKRAVDEWTAAAGIDGVIFRRVSRMGKIWGDRITPKAIWHVVKAAAKRAGITNLAPHDLRRTCARLCHLAGGELEQIQFLLGHASVETTERYLGCKQKLSHAVNDTSGWKHT